MNNDKAFIRHEILNIVTLLNFTILDTSLPSKTKENLLSHLKMIGVLTTEEEFILTQKKEFFNQEVDLDEILSIIQNLLEEVSKRKKVKLVIEKTKLFVHADKNVVRNGLQNILNLLVERAKNIKITTESKSNSLQINYDTEELLEMENENLIQYLKAKHSYFEIFCKLAIEAMRQNGIKVNFEKNQVIIIFSKL